MLKKATLAGLILLGSPVALAGTMGSICVPTDVTVPCETTFWDFGIQALYLQSVYGGAKAAVNNKWNLGFKAKGSYHYDAGSDITIDWTHYSSDTNQTGFVNLIPVPPFSAPYALTNQNRLDQIDAVFGQFMETGSIKTLRFYGGMQYANLQVNEVNYYPTQWIAPLRSFSPLQLLDNTDFKGFGPVTGIDYSYSLLSALKLTAQGAGSLLYGTSRYSSDFVATSTGLVLLPIYAAVKAVIPTVQAKLGLSYEYNNAYGTMEFEAGYQAINYFNVLQAQPSQNPFNPITTNNYGLYGPYFGFKYLGNI